MSKEQVNNPLHGVTLEQVVNSLVESYGWEDLGKRVDINCFKNDPSVKSSLKFLRKSPWARQKVEDLYLFMKKSDRKLRAKKGESPASFCFNSRAENTQKHITEPVLHRNQVNENDVVEVDIGPVDVILDMAQKDD